MTQDEIIEMAKEADLHATVHFRKEQLRKFAKLVADVVTAKEREACAKVCEELVIEVVGNSALAVDQCARTIRARDEA
jgi:hypothetical protein